MSEQVEEIIDIEEDRLKYKTTNDIISEIHNRMVEMEKDKIY